ncbi:CobW family GTP-binding protein [Bradyrhizobium sp. SYSU BS000235]|uniref:CobW family GTP-binding protein n=1 Tax=Bradyrhizobium sp. SYSU BS000235 TaxID=3411332 RepID=UPI003C71E468
MMAGSHAKTPVTVIGGFLGAGKTTFLNHLLRNGGERYAVLVNDFGAINVDASLIVQHDGTTMTLANGCVCCSIGDGFLETLGKILDNETPFNHIIIEASGVGDPWRIAEIALVEPGLRLNAVVVVADAARISGLLVDARVGDTVRNQFAHCNMVLLNKVDLLTRAEVAAARADVAALRHGMSVVETTQHTLPDLPNGAQATVARFTAIEAGDRADHERVFRRWSYRRNGAFDPAKLERALSALPPQLLRLKGSCRLAGDALASLLQMVGQDWALSPAPDEMASQDDIMLVGVGTDALPDVSILDTILDGALIDTSQTHITNADINRSQAELTL